MSIRILSKSERKSIHNLIGKDANFHFSDYDQNDENMQRRLLFLQFAVTTGLSLSALMLWLSANIH